MSDFWVHGVDALDDDAAARLAAVHPEWWFSDGDVPPEGAAYDVLVAGRPSLQLLTASKRLRTLVIPFAGVPATTSELLRAHPEIAVRTVHHTAGPTAELALGLVLAAARALVPADQAMRVGDWTPRFVPPTPTMILAEHPAVVVGYGEVGRRVARSLVALDMEVHAIRGSTSSPYADGDVLVHPTDEFATLASRARVVVLAAPATPRTAGLLSAEVIDGLPTPSVVVNVARATLVDEKALYNRLLTGEIAAGLDVWWTEASSADAATGVAASAEPFHELPNVVLSPHRGGAFSLREVRDLRLAEVEKALVTLAGGRAAGSRDG
ncbi:NAD(P)-dependent oxidoreductase [Kribbella ginsengisoli]|uniref:D-isomer specific 2-hydroxyacid dehydrogenase NAD-binding domain-containing protein n=1 Tax=Kribbella ginsengisoli TaxID=363865 RepID=A0ABP6VVL7_9ACTN